MCTNDIIKKIKVYVSVSVCVMLNLRRKIVVKELHRNSC